MVPAVIASIKERCNPMNRNEVKRYNLELTGRGYEPYPEMQPDEDGEWVRAKDWLTLEQQVGGLEKAVERANELWNYWRNLAIERRIKVEELHADKAKLQSDLEQAQEEMAKLKEAINTQTMQAIGWMYAEACETLDEGRDFRHVPVPGLIERFYRETGAPDAD